MFILTVRLHNKMRRNNNILRYFVILSILINNTIVYSQTNENKIAKNIINYELGGTGVGIVSLNYERNLLINESIIFAPSVGASLSKYIHVGGTYNFYEYQIFIPIQVNMIFGKYKHHFETGFGMPFAIDKDKFKLIGGTYVLRFGYRYQKKSSGLIFRASINPLLMVFMPTIYAGISVGYAF